MKSIPSPPSLSRVFEWRIRITKYFTFYARLSQHAPLAYNGKQCHVTND